MTKYHDSNRRHWNEAAKQWEELRDKDGLWQRCPNEPDLGFAGGALQLIREVAGNISGKDVCVIGSGDNYAAFALAGMGANVTSIDISEQQLEVAARRAEQLGLSMAFVQADAADLKSIGDEGFDLVCSSNGFFVWIADLQAVFNEILHILRPGGHYVFYDIHPFQRPWKDQIRPIEVERPYWETGPIGNEKNGTFVFNWTLADILNPVATSGFILRKILESAAEDSRYWQGSSYMSGTDERLLGWNENPRAALPVWLTVALQRPSQ
ncbi:MAG: methyltransferase domain-containing protein [Gemmatimonadota bacterium]|nr:methyltransferase domain-containing protein [Gemmatimonadota bacterium]